MAVRSITTGEVVLNVMGAIAQFERQMLLERQREGIAKGKLEGRYMGRAPTARAKADEIRRLDASTRTASASTAHSGSL